VSGFRKIFSRESEVNSSGFSLVFHFCEGYPPPPISPQGFQSKIVNSKVFKNKDLAARHIDFGVIWRKCCCAIRWFSVDFSKILKLVSASLRTVSGDGRTSEFLDPIVIIARRRPDVCDRVHRRFVMKKEKRSWGVPCANRQVLLQL